MSRTMKIEEDVAVRLAALKKKFKRATYSDLLESFCDFFEVTRLEPTDLDSSRKPPSVVITERTNRVISFIKKGEDKYLKEILNLVEKIYLNMGQAQAIAPREPEQENERPVLAQKREPGELDLMVRERTRALQEENTKCRTEVEEMSYKMDHQKKLIKEFMGKVTQGKFGGHQISSAVFAHYKSELEKL